MAASAAPDVLPKLLPPPPPTPSAVLRRSAAFLRVGDLPRHRQIPPPRTRAASLRHRCRAPITRVSRRSERRHWSWLLPSTKKCPCGSTSCTASTHAFQQLFEGIQLMKMQYVSQSTSRKPVSGIPRKSHDEHPFTNDCSPLSHSM